MSITSNELLIVLSLLVISSYLFNFISHKLNVPSVLLLITTGILLKIVSINLSIDFIIPQHTLELMGTLGLILIVLEASLELNLSKQELPFIRNAFFSAASILVISMLSIAGIIYFWLNSPLKNALINAIPLAVVSSAIAIPSVAGMNKKIRNFIVYESTFSDILGILIFNYAIQDGLMTIGTIGKFGLNIILIIIISLAGSLLLIFLINRITHSIKFFLILSILFFIYALGKEFHLPSLLLVLVFGLMINNSELFIIKNLKGYFNTEKLKSDILPFKTITDESAFLIRTFFFVLFGYSVNLDEIFQAKVLLAGFAIVLIILAIRYLYLRFTVKEPYRIIKLFLAPRGLITVILFYSIPAQYIIPEFSIGVVFVVIICTGLAMMISLWLEKSRKDFTLTIKNNKSSNVNFTALDDSN